MTKRPSPIVWVYPRVCGGAYKAVENFAYREGLSPRVRGSPLA